MFLNSWCDEDPPSEMGDSCPVSNSNESSQWANMAVTHLSFESLNMKYYLHGGPYRGFTWQHFLFKKGPTNSTNNHMLFIVICCFPGLPSLAMFFNEAKSSKSMEQQSSACHTQGLPASESHIGARTTSGFSTYNGCVDSKKIPFNCLVDESWKMFPQQILEAYWNLDDITVYVMYIYIYLLMCVFYFYISQQQIKKQPGQVGGWIHFTLTLVC